MNLTTRETEMSILLCKEYADKEIAHELGIAIRTVEQTMRNLRNKLDVKTRIGVAIHAIKTGIFTP